MESFRRSLDFSVPAAKAFARRLGFFAYHSLRAINYQFELYARPIRTVAGEIRSYELANSHGDDQLLAIIEANAGPAETIYDIGAYVGEYALALAADDPDRTVVAFEPDPRHCAQFQKNRCRTAPAGTVTLREAGVGEKTGVREFYRSSFPKLSSFDRADATRWGATVTSSQPVEVRSLDETTDLPAPDHIKIDTEGHAPAVLRGATELVGTEQPILYIETHDRPGIDRTAAIREWCDTQGYAIHTRTQFLVCYPPSKSVELDL